MKNGKRKPRVGGTHFLPTERETLRGEQFPSEEIFDNVPTAKRGTDRISGDRDKRMVRGTQKKVVYIKNTGGAVFDEAFFLLKEERGSGFSGDDILREADRIIAERTVRGGHREEKRGIFLPAWLFFLFGMLFSVLVSSAAFLLFLE